jgi:putative tryptophan/tyrosine transport system substrate-binding protein
MPIVCPLLADPIGFGLIASVARPGGSVTGLLFRSEGLAGKQLELARELIPDAARIGYVLNVASGIIIDRQELESANRRLGVTLVPAEVSAPGDLD